MRFQFSTRQILLATVFVAITCSGVLTFRYGGTSFFEPTSLPWFYVGFYTLVTTSLWVPSIFIAYAIGRRSFTTQLVVIFAVTELIAIFISWGAFHMMD